MGLYQAVDGRLHELLRPNGADAVPPLHVIDVGASGGINPVWRHWGDRLSAVGFDMIGSEVARLAEAERNPAVSYRHVRIASVDSSGRIGRPPAAARTNYAVHRSSGYLATAILAEKENTSFEHAWRSAVRHPNPPTNAAFANHDAPEDDPYIGYYLRLFSRGKELDLASRRATLDEEVPAVSLDRPTFLKVDVDGYELDVLEGATALLSSGHMLGVDVEIQFHGPAEPGGGAFADVDLLLRGHGFTLFELETVRHGRSALPRPFAISEPAETVGGPIQWGNALYLRDFGDPLYAEKWPGIAAAASLDHRRCLTLLLDIFGMPDAAAEVVRGSRGLFAPVASDEAMLSALTQRLYGTAMDYSTLTSRFASDPKAFCRPYRFDARSLTERVTGAIQRRLRRIIEGAAGHVRH